ncbi:MAG: dTDP-4-dehydrorhamnose 3,5-epimerase [Chthonomonas sp.]|nr:dTDP-4-dehydrorhamnose 3,5-epimerase [Chthonomonas sp.]
MNVTPLGRAGVLLFEPQAFGDTRGWFMEGWKKDRYRDAGIELDFMQFNVSRSAKGVLRGLHFQEPNPQGKLVMALHGAVFDVAVDIRVGSPTFGQWWGADLTDENHHQLWVPPGFAHGFEVLSETALFAYLVTDSYQPENDRAIRFDDPEIGVTWKTADPQLSVKDQVATLLRDAPALPRY